MMPPARKRRLVLVDDHTLFRDGLRMDGTWKRDGPLDMFTFWDASGKQLLLEPGQTWIHFIYPTWSVTSAP